MLTTENSIFTLYCLLPIFKNNKKRIIDCCFKTCGIIQHLKSVYLENHSQWWVLTLFTEATDFLTVSEFWHRKTNASLITYEHCCYYYLPLLANPALIWVLSILRRFLTSDNHKMAEKDKKGFVLSKEKEQVLFPPPFTLLNNKTKRNADCVLSTLWALNYSFLVHSFTQWIQRCEPISHAQRVLICISNQGRVKEKIQKIRVTREREISELLSQNLKSTFSF